MTIVFADEQRSGSSSGTFLISGSGSSSGQSGAGDRAFTEHYSGGVTTLEFRKYLLQLRDAGKTLTVQGEAIDISQGKVKVKVIIKEDGSFTVEEI